MIKDNSIASSVQPLDLIKANQLWYFWQWQALINSPFLEVGYRVPVQAEPFENVPLPLEPTTHEPF
jgi:hypothetical protein